MKWNEEAAPNNNLTPKNRQISKLAEKPKDDKFSEELADGGERNHLIQRQALNNIK